MKIDELTIRFDAIIKKLNGPDIAGRTNEIAMSDDNQMNRDENQ